MIQLRILGSQKLILIQLKIYFKTFREKKLNKLKKQSYQIKKVKIVDQVQDKGITKVNLVIN